MADWTPMSDRRRNPVADIRVSDVKQMTPDRPKAAAKAELRREIKELRSIGGLMSNVFFNWSQHKSVIDPDERKMLKQLRVEWDAIKRAEQAR